MRFFRNVLRLDVIRQTVGDLNRHRAALDGGGNQFIYLVFGGRRHGAAACLRDVKDFADIVPGCLATIILVNLPDNGRVTFFAGADVPPGIFPLLERAGIRDVGVLAGQ